MQIQKFREIRIKGPTSPVVVLPGRILPWLFILPSFLDTNPSKLEAILDNNTADSEFLDSTGSAVINLATIEEQPELGYQSDSEGISAMSSTLKNSSNRKSKDSNSSIGSSGNHLALGTLTEDSKEIEENEEKVTKIVEIENLTLQK